MSSRRTRLPVVSCQGNRQTAESRGTPEFRVVREILLFPACTTAAQDAGEGNFIESFPNIG